MVLIIENKHLAHIVIIDEKGNLLLKADIGLPDAKKLIEASEPFDLSEAQKPLIAKLSYSLPAKLWAYDSGKILAMLKANGATGRELAKKVRTPRKKSEGPKPAKKAAKKHPAK